MKRITKIFIVLSILFIVPSIAFKLANLFLTANCIFYVSIAIALYLAITGVKKDLEKK
jgi:hypothetical protein